MLTRKQTRSQGLQLALVEDDEQLAQLLQYNFVAHGFSVDVIDDGQKALPRFSELRPNLILLDWSLPGLSGIEVLRQIRSSPSLCTTPVVMLTARCTPEDRARALSTGADAFFAKPFSIGAVTSALERLAVPHLSKLQGDVTI